MTFLGAVQLLVLGIIGSYLGRLYEQSKGRPLFVIDRVVRGGAGGEAAAEEEAADNGAARAPTAAVARGEAVTEPRP
jgi:hypothetical protein